MVEYKPEKLVAVGSIPLLGNLFRLKVNWSRFVGSVGFFCISKYGYSCVMRSTANLFLKNKFAVERLVLTFVSI